MRVYHFISAEFGLSNIEKRRLKIARFADLNDPFEGLAIALPDPARRQAWQGYVAKMNRAFGLLCFSKNWRNPVHRSHYADRHKGICLGFDVADELALEVIYRRRPYEANFMDGIVSQDSDLASDMLLTVMRTKFAHWRYEQEVRLLTAVDDPEPISGIHFSPFSSRLSLAEVIVGHRSPVTRHELTKALGDLAGAVTTFKARLSFRSYSVVKQRAQSLWE